MVSKYSQVGLWHPFQMAFLWLINGSTNYLYTNWDDPPRQFSTYSFFLEESFFCTTLHGDLLVKVVCSRRSQDIYDRVQKTPLFAHIFQNVFLWWRCRQKIGDKVMLQKHHPLALDQSVVWWFICGDAALILGISKGIITWNIHLQ